MNKPITLCDRCKEYARCCLNYDGDNCRRIRTVEPTNADRIRSMTDEELAEWLWFKVGKCPPFDVCPSQCTPCEAKDCWLDWLMEKLKPCPFCGSDMLSYKIEVKGNCTACGKPLRENDGLFLCAECQKKNKEEE